MLRLEIAQFVRYAGTVHVYFSREMETSSRRVPSGCSVEAAEGLYSQDLSSSIQIMPPSSALLGGMICEASAPVVSILDRLRAPKPSELSRKRTVDRNPPPKLGKRRARGTVLASDPKSASAGQRVREFNDERLNVSHGKLF